MGKVLSLERTLKRLKRINKTLMRNEENCLG